MTPQEAIEVFEQVRRQVQLPGAQHDTLRDAVATLARTVQECERLRENSAGNSAGDDRAEQGQVTRGPA